MMLVSLFTLAQSPKDVVSKSKESNALEEKIVDTIAKLPECRKRAAYIEKQTNGQRQLRYVIYEEASKEKPYYWVKAWEDNGITYVTHFNFYVYQKPFRIQFYDTVNDKVISLKEWRKQSRRRTSP